MKQESKTKMALEAGRKMGADGKGLDAAGSAAGGLREPPARLRVREIGEPEGLMPVTPILERAAGAAYTAYCAAVGGVAWNGDRLPDWPTFRSDVTKGKQIEGWIRAAQAAGWVLETLWRELGVVTAEAVREVRLEDRAMQGRVIVLPNGSRVVMDQVVSYGKSSSGVMLWTANGSQEEIHGETAAILKKLDEVFGTETV